MIWLTFAKSGNIVIHDTPKKRPITQDMKFSKTTM